MISRVDSDVSIKRSWWYSSTYGEWYEFRGVGVGNWNGKTYVRVELEGTIDLHDNIFRSVTSSLTLACSTCRACSILLSSRPLIAYALFRAPSSLHPFIH